MENETTYKVLSYLLIILSGMLIVLYYNTSVECTRLNRIVSMQKEALDSFWVSMDNLKELTIELLAKEKEKNHAKEI